MSEEAKDDVQQVKAERLQRSHGRLIRVVSVFPQQGSATPEDKLKASSTGRAAGKAVCLKDWTLPRLWGIV